MRLLLISDTHGKLEIINKLAGHVRADAIIHAEYFLGRRCVQSHLEKIQIQHPYRIRPVKQEDLKNGESENSASVSGSKSYFR